MAVYANMLNIAPNSALSRTLKAAVTSGDFIVVNTGDEMYTLMVTQTESTNAILLNTDPQSASDGVRALDDALAGVDRTQLLCDLRGQRDQDSSGRPA